MTEYLVFISHASEDTWIAKAIERQVLSCGAVTFLDASDVRAGDEFEEEIRLALTKATELIILLTPWALNSRYVWTEISIAWFRRIRTTALLLGVTTSDIQSDAKVPVLLKRIKLLRLNDVDRYFAELADRIWRRALTNDQA